VASAEHIALPDDTEVLVRPLKPTDRDLVATVVARLSADSRMRRFFRSVPELSERELAYLTDVDHHDHEALGALDPATGEPVGVARYLRLHPGADTAEAAIAVVDAWQNRGVGRVLLERLALRAREEGVVRFHALVQADNPRALHLFGELGATRVDHEIGAVRLAIELPEGDDETPGAQLARLLWHTAHTAPPVQLWFWLTELALASLRAGRTGGAGDT
jgi:GNAT superfamily N-acetyltransferase